MKRIEEFEGLRGLLAMWVFLSHILALTGYGWGGFRQPFNTFVNATFAVDVFMILSGFVVSMLILTRREPYALFIGRRFLRLYPAYVVCVGSALVLSLTGVIPPNYDVSHLPAYLAAHAVMLHGVIPNSVLPHASGSFLTPAWSISTEWQFYLLIPLFFAAFRFRRLKAWGVLLVVALLASRLANHFGRWDHSAFLPLKLNYFALGVLSCFIFMWAEKKKESLQGIGSYITVTLLFFTLMFSVFTSQLGLYVWLIVFGSVLAVRLNEGTGLDNCISTFLKSKLLQWLGVLSYSIYLSHEILIRVVIKVFKGVVPDISNFPLLLVVTLFSIPATFIVSHLLFHCVEAPAIRFGKRLSNRTSTPDSSPDQVPIS